MRVPVGKLALVAALVTTVGMPMVGAAAAQPERSAPVRAIVTLRAAGPVSVPGVRVVTVFAHIGSEVVVGTPAALRRLSADPRVAGISPDDRVGFASHDNDKRHDQYAWQRMGGSAGHQNAGAGVTVAVLDTGVSDTPALNRASGRLVDGVDTSQLFDGGEASTSGTFDDGYGHGTFMANLIAGAHVDAAPRNLGVGVAPMARVVVVKVADAQGTTSLSEVLAGMDWVAVQAPKIQVLNVALSHQRPGDSYGADPLTAAVDHVLADGVLVVAAAGNTAGVVGDPGFDPKAITVGAADLTYHSPRVAPFSGSANIYGLSKPDVVASGVGLLSYLPPDSVIARENPLAAQPNGLWRGSGTSEATAVTTGAIATLLSDNPQARLLDVKGALRLAADQIDGDAGQGRGLLDLDNAFNVVVNCRPGTTAGCSRYPNGEDALNQRAWDNHVWLHGTWIDWLANSWSANSWSDGSWSANSWSANSWSTANWTANSWSANSWSANSWSANSWSANSWSANSWSANSWSANSWSANSWSANSWSAQSWGDDR
ncbi:MAG: S8 family serine peptidase [Actinomycetes bacterium]